MSADQALNSDVAHVVVLGASNVTLGFPRIVAEVRRLFPGRVQIFAAHGHGRSYGRASWAPFRTLPGLRESGLWNAFRSVRDQARATGQQVPVYALVTDIGNDLLFGSSPEQIDEWIAECGSWLRAENARITIGRPPVFALERLGRMRFSATRTFFFPQSPLTYERMLEDVPRLDSMIAARAIELGADSFIPRPEWYGFDPIHIRRRSRPAAWNEILGRWLGEGLLAGEEPARDIRRRHWLLAPAERTIWGAKRTRTQPAFRWEDGSGIWLY
jgi:hypothetical protein